MKMLHDFWCNSCEISFEKLAEIDSQITHDCGSFDVVKRITGGRIFTEIVATSKTSKKYKAGYQHTHGNKPKTPGKIQVGYTGK